MNQIAKETLAPESEASETAQQYEAQSRDLLTMAKQFEISTADDYERANESLKGIIIKKRELDERRKAITRPIDDAKKRIMDLFQPALKYLEDAEQTIKRDMLVWNREQERLRQEREARLREQQRKEREKLQQQAEKASASGKTEKAEALLQQADMTDGVSVAPATPKTSSSVRKTWQARVTDKAALIKAAAERPDLQALLNVDQTALNAMARGLKSNLSIPGVEAYQRESISTRT